MSRHPFSRLFEDLNDNVPLHSAAPITLLARLLVEPQQKNAFPCGSD